MRGTLLNLPVALRFTNGNRTDYLYGSDGMKRRVTYSTAVANVGVPMGEIRSLSSSQVSATHTVDYCGNVIYEGGNLSKILTEEGYITLSGSTPTYHYYLKDHQGNNRVVTYWNGSKWFVEQVNHYYPFGGVFAEGTAVSNQAYKYNGKELDRMHGLDWYDYSARMYDAALGRFTTMDPMAEKYYSTSPYAYVENNPIRHIDINGDSITVLNKNDGEHLALLIQNNEGKWQYFSVNGNNVYFSGKHIGGREFNDLGQGEFGSPQQFLESTYNSKGDKDDKTINDYGFGEGYIIPTTQEQDETIRNTFVDISNNEEYRLNPVNPNQCATVVQRSLNKVGIETRVNRTITNRSTGGDSYQIKFNPYLPSQAFKSIMYNNPQGQYIKRLK